MLYKDTGVRTSFISRAVGTIVLVGAVGNSSSRDNSRPWCLPLCSQSHCAIATVVCEITRPRQWSMAEHHHIGQKQNQEEHQKKKKGSSSSSSSSRVNSSSRVVVWDNSSSSKIEYN